MHLTLKKETVRPPGSNILQQQAKFDDLVHEFNRERPHEALGMKCPAEVYTPSTREYRGLPEVSYPFHDREIVVTACGRICLLTAPFSETDVSYQPPKVHPVLHAEDAPMLVEVPIRCLCNALQPKTVREDPRSARKWRVPSVAAVPFVISTIVIAQQGQMGLPRRRCSPGMRPSLVQRRCGGVLQGATYVMCHCNEFNARESEADEITREVLTALRRSFITPLDRGGIKDLITSMDDGIDHCGRDRAERSQAGML